VLSIEYNFWFIEGDNRVYNKTVLDNGLRIISEQIPGVKSFSLGVCVNVGSRDDFDKCDGLAHFVEHSVFRRTKNKTSKKISEEFESLGAYTNAFTTKEITCFYVRALSDNFQKILNLLYDITIEPIFVDKDVNKERSIITEEIKSYYDDPEELIMDFADEAIFANSALAHPIIGSEESVQSITTDDIAKFHSQFFVPSNLVLSCVGDIPHSQLVKFAEKRFGKISNKELVKPKADLSIYNTTKSVFDKDYAQNHILYCKRMCQYASEERYPMTALNFILGEGMSSRLNITLREKFGMVYSVYSNLHFFSDSGVLSIYAGSERKNIKKIESIIESEVRKLISYKITAKELSRAKEQLKANAIMSMESLSSRMQNLAKSEFMIGRNQDADELIEHINAINMESMNNAIEKYLELSNWSEIIFKIN